MNAETFNSRYPVGTPVVAYPACRPEDHPGDRRLITRTRSKAQVLGGHTDVVWVDGHSACIALSHVDPVSEDEFKAARAAETAAAVAEQGALPMPVGNAPDRLQAASRLMAEREAEIREHVAATKNWSLGNLAARDLLAELDRTRTELAKYVGHEPTIAEEMTYLSRCLNAVCDLCDATEKQATRWENPLPVPEWVEDVRKAADGDRPDDPADNRRRIYIDGKGNGWISVCSEEGVEYVVPVEPAAALEQAVEEVADEAGGLREIGRCW
ncbi:hypothetical protein [Streptomyces sp. NPDC020747]|uniref:hypothetical protein n=1 Tax=Streptomyces sp. NPDC020747 TaxID=3365086 RepID=UPI0037AFDF2F